VAETSHESLGRRPALTDMLNVLVSYVCPGTMLVFVGILVSLLARLSSIADRGRRSITARIITAFILGTVSFLIAFGLVAQLGTGAEYSLCWHLVDTYGRQRLQMNRNAVLKELWIRRIVPPPLRRSCYTTSSVYVCTLADAVSAISNLAAFSWTWQVIMSLTSAAITGSLVWGRIRRCQLVEPNAA
jgi:hypothetical protein